MISELARTNYEYLPSKYAEVLRTCPRVGWSGPRGSPGCDLIECMPLQVSKRLGQRKKSQPARRQGGAQRPTCGQA